MVLGGEENGICDLASLLDEIASEAFRERACRIVPGREYLFFSADRTVLNLVRAVGREPSRKAIEARLDQWFEELREGELFEYTESIMALLFALHRSEPMLFREIAKPFSRSRAAEIARLSRYAARLLGRREPEQETVNAPVLSPPWVVYHERGLAAILPAGQPGLVLEWLDPKVAEVIVAAANKWARRKPR